MKLSTGLESGLHEMVKDKQTHISQMQAHHVMQERWGYGKLAHKTKSHLDDERDHMKATLGYMAQRDVVPKMEHAGANVKTDVESQILADLAYEQQHVKKLNDFIILARHAGEDSLRRMIEHVVKDDEAHVAELEKQLNLIKTLGMSNYLHKVSKV